MTLAVAKLAGMLVIGATAGYEVCPPDRTHTVAWSYNGHHGAVQAGFDVSRDSLEMDALMQMREAAR